MNKGDALYCLKLLGGYITSEDPLVVGGLDELGIEIYELFLEEAILADYIDLTDNQIRANVEAVLERVAPDARFVLDEASNYGMFVIWGDLKDDAKFEAEFTRLYGEDNLPRLDCGYPDEYDTCERCGKLVRTSPDCYGWQPEFYIFEDFGLTCDECVESNFAEEYVDEFVNQNRLLNDYVVSPSRFDWNMLEEPRFENGLHPGQNDDPQKIIDTLNAAGIDCLFTGNVGQFDVNFYVWVRDGEQDRAYDVIMGHDVTLGYDKATEMEKAMKGEHSDHIKVVTRKITLEEFVSGDWAREEADVSKIEIDYGQEDTDE